MGSPISKVRLTRAKDKLSSTMGLKHGVRDFQEPLTTEETGVWEELGSPGSLPQGRVKAAATTASFLWRSSTPSFTCLLRTYILALPREGRK